MTAKTNHFRTIAFFVLKAGLFVVLTFLLLKRLQSVDFSLFSWSEISFPYLFVSVLLIPFNYFFEWKKWENILRHLGCFQPKKAIASFASGTVSAFLTPAFSGNFLGRVWYFPARMRWKLTIHSLVSNFSQFLTTVFFGCGALLTLHLTNHYTFSTKHIALAFLVLVSALFIFFFGERLAQVIKWNRIQSAVLIVKRGPSRGKQLFFSVIRYLIYAAQFSFALRSFGVEAGWELHLWVSLVYFVVTLTPSLFFGKIVIRESLAVSILGLAGYATVPVLFASLFIWLINLLLPSFVAAFFVRRIQIDA